MLKNLTSEPIIFLYSIVYMINLSMLPQLVLQKVCLKQFPSIGDTLNSTSSLKDFCYTKTDMVMSPAAEKESARWWFIIIASAQIPSILTVLIWGPISDVIGRKKALLVIPSVSILQNIIFVLCSYYITSNLVYLCFGMFLSCLFGEFAGVIALCYGFIADVTAGENSNSRTARMAFIDCSINLAGLPAGILAGQLLKWIGFTAVFSLSITLNVILLMYIVFVLPDLKRLLANAEATRVTEASKNVDDVSADAKDLETNKLVVPALERSSEVSSDASSTSECSQAFDDETKPFKHQAVSSSRNEVNWDLLKPHKQIYKVYKVISHKERRHLVLPPLLAFSFVIYAFVGELTTTALYLRGKPLAMTPDLVGYYYASQAVLRGIGVIAVTQIVYRVLNTSDINVMLFGISSQIGCYILIGFSTTTLAVFFANVVGFAVSVGLSLSRSYTSKHVPPKDIGTLMAAFEALDAMAFTTNLLTSEIYSLTLDKFAGTAFLFLAGCALVGFIITFVNKLYLKKHTREVNKEIDRKLNEQPEV